GANMFSFFKRSRKSRRASQGPRQVRLGLEQLEERELMSASAILGNGDRITLDNNQVLWETVASSGQQVQIDHNVQSFAVAPSGTLYDLSTNGNLGQYANGNWAVID